MEQPVVMKVHQKKCCIVGTAPSWRRTPWHDRSIECWSLNDAYMLGHPRIDRYFELHPLDKMYFRPRNKPKVMADDVPPGFYVRPEGHLDVLRQMAQTIPVFLQSDPPPDWPAKAQRFPIESVEAAFGGNYWASGPAYMLAQAVLEGYTEIWITGIHLSTEHEYREQRPQLESLMGRLLGRGVQEVRTEDGWRVYDGDIRIVLPKESPLLMHEWRYAYEAKPAPVVSPYEAEMKRTVKEKNELVRQLVHWPEGQSRQAALARLSDLEVIEMDIQMQWQKRHIGSTLRIDPVVRAA